MSFQSEVLNPRILRSIVWHLLLQLASVQAFLLTYHAISWYPVMGIHTWLSKLFSATSLVYHFFLSVISLFFALLHLQNYSVQHLVPITRLQAVWNFLHPQRLVYVITLSFFGSLVIFCFTQLLGGEITSLQDPCEGDCSTSGINGQHLFVLLYGIYAGAVYSLKYFKDGWYLVRFPIIQQMKFLTVKSRIPELLVDSILQVLRNLHWYYALYFMFGSYPKNWLSVILGVQKSSNTSFNEIFNFSLLLITVGSGTTLYFIWTLYLCLCNVYLTERHEFLIKATIGGEKERVLSKALTSTNFDTLKYLAFLDLRLLVQNSAARRSELFSISQPGGHPYLWEAVSSVCISSLENFLYKLNELSTAAMTNATKLSAAQTPIVGTPVSASHSHLALSSFSSSNLASCISTARMQFSPSIKPGSIADSGLGIASYLITSLKKIQEAIRRKPAVAYFLNELPDAKAKRLFSSCQPVIWIIEALSFLVCASYKEDRYGVVQQSFPRILCLLIDLKLSEEKLQLGTISVKRHSKESSSLQKETLLRHSLKSALNSSLYRIVITFKKHINGVLVPDEYRRHIKRYLDFKE